jgi:hypothetical protein
MTEPSKTYSFVPYLPPRLSEGEMLERARACQKELDARRSVRSFSDDPVPRELIQIAIEVASSAPSGAHRQPWKFVAVNDSSMKREIRIAAEEEEKQSYEVRMPRDWR